MRKLWLVAVLILVLTCPAIAFAGGLPNKPQAPYTYVQDYAGIFNAQQLSQLNDQATALKNKTTGEVVIITVVMANANKDEARILGTDAIHQWGVGDKAKDNGVAIVIAATSKADFTGTSGKRAFSIATGYGSEGPIPDSKAVDIATNQLPYLKSRDYFSATKAAMNEIETALNSDSDLTKTDPKPPSTGGSSSDFTWLCLSAFILLGAAFAAIFFVRQKTRVERERLAEEAEEALRMELEEEAKKERERASRAVTKHTSQSHPAPDHGFIPPVPSKSRPVPIPVPVPHRQAKPDDDELLKEQRRADERRRQDEEDRRRREDDARRRREEDEEEERRRRNDTFSSPPSFGDFGSSGSSDSGFSMPDFGGGDSGGGGGGVDGF